MRLVITLMMLVIAGSGFAKTVSGTGSWEEIKQDAEASGSINFTMTLPDSRREFRLTMTLDGDDPCEVVNLSAVAESCEPFQARNKPVKITVSGHVWFDYWGGKFAGGGIFNKDFELIGWHSCDGRRSCKTWIKVKDVWFIVEENYNGNGMLDYISGQITPWLDPDEYYIDWTSKEISISD